MDQFSDFEKRLTPAQLKTLQDLKSPLAIQEYLDGLPYIAEELDRSPLRVMTDRQAHCLDGGIFAALCLWRLGFLPLILDLVPEPGADDDHVLALYRVKGLWGALAKSNYTGLRVREPVHRSLRELAMTYFENFYNLERRKTLRAYTRPLNLARFRDPGWMWSETTLKQITLQLYRLKPIPLITPEVAAELNLADDRSYKAATAETNFDWVYGNR